MNLAIPQNLYAALFALSLPDNEKEDVIVKPSSMLVQELENGNADVALLPSCDLLKHKDLFVSKEIGISFDGSLTPAYIYFKPDQHDLKELYIRGDVSTNEIILTKILFSERYNTDVTIHLDTGELDLDNKNYLIVGNENLEEDRFKRGVSFADQMAALLDFPYVNFVLAAKDEKKLSEFIDGKSGYDKLIEDKLDEILKKINLDESVTNHIRENFNSVYYEITPNEQESLHELIKLIYYHGITDDIIELKLV